MKLRLFATAALAAAAISAPALAQDVTGSIGVNAAHTEFDALGFEAEGEAYGIDASVAWKTTSSWNIALNGSVTGAETDFGSDTTYSLGGSTTHAGSDWRAGFAGGYTDLDDAGLWTVGVVGQKYIGDWTVSGVASWGAVKDYDADVWTVGGDVRYFVSDNFRINAGASWNTIDVANVDVDGWNAGVGAEYQFAGSGWSITGAYDHAELSDFDASADTFKLGVRYSFGGDLKARDRSGADISVGSNALLGVL